MMDPIAQTDLWGRPIETQSRGPLADRFQYPPFSVLSARDGWWQDRKRAWIGLGIKSELGRGSNELGLSQSSEDYRNGRGSYAKTYNSGSPGSLARGFADRASPGQSRLPAANYANRERGSGSGKAISGTSANGCRPHAGGSRDERPGRPPGEEYTDGDAWVASANNSGTSIFDPVLCELVYRWFAPAAGQVLDPFAGGSVRGIVAGTLGLRYHGIDLRAEQVAANNEQADSIGTSPRPVWVCGDSIDETANAPDADLVFSCPPYGDLERYSDDPRDLSTMEYHTFKASMGRIILRAVTKLKPNRFAVFVVGDFRDAKGFYRNFVGDTVRAFEDAGARFYNDAVIVTAVGSLPIRVGKQFTASRKLGKTHQNLLVFVKGDPKEAAGACRAVEVAELVDGIPGTEATDG